MSFTSRWIYLDEFNFNKKLLWTLHSQSQAQHNTEKKKELKLKDLEELIIKHLPAAHCASQRLTN